MPIGPGIATKNVGYGIIHGIAKLPGLRIVAPRDGSNVETPQIIDSLHDCPDLSLQVNGSRSPPVAAAPSQSPLLQRDSARPPGP